MGVRGLGAPLVRSLGWGASSLSAPAAPVISLGTQFVVNGTITWSAVSGATSYRLQRNGVDAGAVTSPYTIVGDGASARDIGPSITVTAVGPGGTSAASNALVFSGSSLSNCVVALDADTGITLVSSAVSVWADQSGKANDHSQGTAGLRPTMTTLANGKTAVRFNVASTQCLSCAAMAALASTTPGWTVAACYETVADPTTVTNGTLWSGATGWLIRVGASTTGKPQTLFGSTNPATTGTSVGAATLVRYRGWRDASGGGTRQSSIKLYTQAQVDGTAGASVAMGSTTPASVIGAFTAAGAQPSDMKLRTFLIYERTLGADEMTTLEAYNTFQGT